MSLASEYLEKESRQDYLLKYLMLKLAPVLLRLKPSTLLCLRNCEKSGGRNHYDLWKKQKADIARMLGISFKELNGTSRGKQVLFYNSEVLFNAITQLENIAYLERFGYFSCNAIEDYLEMLKARFCAFGENSFSFPHEIGIFLGYPLKDVKGFIERGTAPLVWVGQWMVFGETRKSMQLMNMHKKAGKVFLNLIKNRRDPINYIKQLSNHFKKLTPSLYREKELPITS